MDQGERIRSILASSGVDWPAPITAFDTLESTSDWLKERARMGATAWTTVVADRQTAGRGRHGASWASPRGNLFLSVLLKPAPAAATVLPLAAGVAVAEAVGAQGAAVLLKWPNDVVVGERKIAGILAEALSGSSGVEAVVVGIGINVSAEREELPPDVRDGATSIRAETGVAADPAALAAAVLVRMRVWYDSLRQHGPRPSLEEWRRRSVPWWGSVVEARSGAQRVRGVARGVDEQGALVLDLPDGTRTAVLAGEVHRVRLGKEAQ